MDRDSNWSFCAIPNYMHVRFSESMLVSSSSVPQGEVFERKDNFYVYLKPYDVADEVVLKRLKFSGKPPVWIPMPPHQKILYKPTSLNYDHQCSDALDSSPVSRLLRDRVSSAL
jgi:hypothetical protein